MLTTLAVQLTTLAVQLTWLWQQKLERNGAFSLKTLPTSHGHAPSHRTDGNNGDDMKTKNNVKNGSNLSSWDQKINSVAPAHTYIIRDCLDDVLIHYVIMNSVKGEKCVELCDSDAIKCTLCSVYLSKM